MAEVSLARDRVAAKSYPPATWEVMRPIFTELYVDKDLKLAEAMNNMSEEHDFHATKSMYKKWIKRWDIGKYMKAAEKDVVIQHAVLGQALPNMDRRGQPMRDDKLRRHLRQSQKRSGQNRMITQVSGQGASTDSSNFVRNDGMQYPTRGLAEEYPAQASVPISPVLTLNAESRLVEFVLRSIRAYFSSLSTTSTQQHFLGRELPLRKSRTSYQRQPIARIYRPGCSFMDDYSKTCYLMRLNMKSAAFQSLSKGAAKVSLALENPDAGLLMDLLALVTWRQWEIFSEHRSLLFHFLALKSKETYPEGHPIALIMQIYSQTGALQRYQRVILDCAVKELEAKTLNTTTDEMTRIRYVLIDSLIDRNDFQPAERLCRLLISENHVSHGEYSHETQYAKLCLGRLLYHSGRCEQSLEILEQIWRPYNAKCSNPKIESVRTAASGWLAYTHEQMNSFYCAEARWWDFFLSHLRLGGAKHPYTLYSLGMLVSFLYRTGRESEIARIQSQYPESYNLLMKDREAEIYQGKDHDARIPHLHIKNDG